MVDISIKNYKNAAVHTIIVIENYFGWIRYKNV